MSINQHQSVLQIHGRNAARTATLIKKERVMIGIPTVSWNITLGIGLFLADAVELSMTPSYPFEFQIATVNDKYPTEYARNCLCKMFLKSECKRLWFVDSDTIPSSNSFELLKMTADISCGIYPIGRGDRGNDCLSLDWSMYNYKPDIGENAWSPLPLEAFDENQIIKCDGAATGCMVIRRHVIEHFAKDAWEDDEGVQAIFFWPKRPNGKSYTSDDFDFCKRALKAGFVLNVHTGVRFGHIKIKNMMDTYEQLKYAFMAGVSEQMQKEEQDASAS